MDPFHIIPLGEDFKIQCFSSFKKVKWFFCPRTDRPEIVLKEWKHPILHIKNADYYHSGHYICYGDNERGQKFIATVYRVIYGRSGNGKKSIGPIHTKMIFHIQLKTIDYSLKIPIE